MLDLRIPFVETSVSNRIENTIKQACKEQAPAIVVGPPGLGKTRTLDQVFAESHDAALIKCTSTNGKLRSFLTEVAESLGVWTSGGRRSGYELEKEILSKLYDFKRRDGVVLIDEAQNLDADAFRTALGFNDHSGIPIVFVGNPEALKRVNGKSPAMMQISDRIAIREEISSFTEDDVVNMAIAYSVTGQDAFDILCRWRRPETTMRDVVRVLDRARAIAGAGAPVLAGHLLDAGTIA